MTTLDPNLSLLMLIPLFVGWAAVQAITSKKPLPWPLHLSLSYGLGTGFLSVYLLLLGVLQIPFWGDILAFSLLPFFPFLILSIYLVFKNLLKGGPKFSSLSSLKTDIKPLTVLLALFIAFQLFFVFWRALNIPVSTWDALSVNVFKAKIIFYEGSLKFLPSMPHPTYPLHTELLQVWITALLNRWDDQAVNSIYPFYYLSLLAIFFYGLRILTNNKWALGGVFLLTTSAFFNYHATIAYRDFTIMFYNCSAILFLLLWNKTKESSWLILAGIFSGIMTLTKLEGTGYLLVHLALLSILLFFRRELLLRKKFGQALKFILPATLASAIFSCYQHFVVSPQLVQSSAVAMNFSLSKINLIWPSDFWARLLTVLKEILANLFLSGNWNILWFLLAVSLIKIRKSSKETKALGLTLVLFFLLYICGYALTQYFFWITETNVALSRQLLHIFPLAVLLIVLLNQDNGETV